MSGISSVSDLPVQSNIPMGSPQVHPNVSLYELPDVCLDQYIQQGFGNYTFPVPSLAYSSGRSSSLDSGSSMGAGISSTWPTVVDLCVPHIFSDIRQNIRDAYPDVGGQNFIEGHLPLEGEGLAQQENARDHERPRPHVFFDNCIFGSILRSEPWTDSIASGAPSRITAPSAETLNSTINPRSLVGQSSISGGASDVNLMPAEVRFNAMATVSLGPTLRLSSMCERPGKPCICPRDGC